MHRLRKTVYCLLILVACWPRFGPPLALATGALFSLTLGNPWPDATGRWSKRLLQVSVVGLGFGLGLVDVWEAARGAVLVTSIGIVFTVVVGRWIGSRLAVNPNTSTLIAFGTAICGGSAIAAMAPVVEARDDETAVALATVFTLNAVGLVAFPALGHALALSPQEFGTWAALAIHDTSSVVGAASVYGGGALAIATTVKLARALWIMPSVAVAAWRRRSEGRVRFPLFVLGFLAAAGLRSLLPDLAPTWDRLHDVARQGLVVTLLLIGTGITRPLLRRVGMRPMLQGFLLWIVVGSASLGVILMGWIR